MDTLILSVFLFVVIPFIAGYISRVLVINKKGLDYFENVFINKFNGVTIADLLLTLTILIDNPFHIVLISVPLILQTILIFTIAYVWCKICKFFKYDM